MLAAPASQKLYPYHDSPSRLCTYAVWLPEVKRDQGGRALLHAFSRDVAVSGQRQLRVTAAHCGLRGKLTPRRAGSRSLLTGRRVRRQPAREVSTTRSG